MLLISQPARVLANDNQNRFAFAENCGWVTAMRKLLPGAITSGLPTELSAAAGRFLASQAFDTGSIPVARS